MMHIIRSNLHLNISIYKVFISSLTQVHAIQRTYLAYFLWVYVPHPKFVSSYIFRYAIFSWCLLNDSKFTITFVFTVLNLSMMYTHICCLHTGTLVFAWSEYSTFSFQKNSIILKTWNWELIMNNQRFVIYQLTYVVPLGNRS